MIGEGDSESILLYLVRRGSCRIEQDGRSCVLGPGELATHDSSRPSVFESVDAMDVVIFNFPKWLLGVRGDSPRPALGPEGVARYGVDRAARHPVPRRPGPHRRAVPGLRAGGRGARRTCSSACCGPSAAAATGMPLRGCARRRSSRGCAGTRWSTCTTRARSGADRACPLRLHALRAQALRRLRIRGVGMDPRAAPRTGTGRPPPVERCLDRRHRPPVGLPRPRELQPRLPRGLRCVPARHAPARQATP